MCVFEMYKIAIEGRNEHYRNYNEWVNLYSIFTGALFIAYYTIADKKVPLLSIIIALAGTVASLCWHLSVMGYYAWMLSWIGVVHDYEKELNSCNANCPKCETERSGRSEKHYVYNVFKDVKGNQEHVSTQKVTRFFVGFLCLMWNALFAISLFSATECIKQKACFISNASTVKMLSAFVILLAFAFEIYFVTSYRKEKLLSSVDGMKGDIHG